MRESKRSKALGWQTSDKTRRMVIENLAAKVRDYNEKGGGIDLYCKHAISEFRSFVVSDSGRPEAAPGKHDDDVMAIAIGMATIEGATQYIETIAGRAYPRDLEMLLNTRSRGVPSSYG